MRNVYFGLVLAALITAVVPATSEAGLIFHRRDCCCNYNYGCGCNYGCNNGCGCAYNGCNSCGYANYGCGCNSCGYAYSGCGCGYATYAYNPGCGCNSPYSAVQYYPPAYNGTVQAGYTPYINPGAEPMPKVAPAK